jgi:hypothetical protein
MAGSQTANVRSRDGDGSIPNKLQLGDCPPFRKLGGLSPTTPVVVSAFSTTTAMVGDSPPGGPSLPDSRLAVDEVVHHHDVTIRLVVQRRHRVARRDAHVTDRRLRENDPEERQARVAW